MKVITVKESKDSETDSSDLVDPVAENVNRSKQRDVKCDFALMEIQAVYHGHGTEFSKFTTQ